MKSQGTTAPQRRGMTHTELLALPVMMNLDVSNRALDLGRTTGYTLARENKYPVKVHRLGNQYRVSRADLLRFLGVDVTSTANRGDAA